MGQERYAMMDHVGLPLNQRGNNPFKENYEDRGLTKYQRTSQLERDYNDLLHQQEDQKREFVDATTRIR